MLPKFHILIGFFFSLIIYLIFPFVSLEEAAIIFFASFLIDFDHYLYYVFKKRNLNLRKAYRWGKEKIKKFSKIPKNKRKEYSMIVFCFHGLEWILFFLILGYFFHPYFYFLGIGMLLHLILDWINSIKNLNRLIKFSLIFDYFHNKKLKKF